MRSEAGFLRKVGTPWLPQADFVAGTRVLASIGGEAVIGSLPLPARWEEGDLADRPRSGRSHGVELQDPREG